MAQSGRFSLALRVLCLLAEHPNQRQTSASLAEATGTGPVMVRRLFGVLHKHGFIIQRKGPAGGAQLKHSAKSIGLGDIFLAAEPDWLQVDDPTLDPILQRTRKSTIAAMNETTLAHLVKKRKKSEGDLPKP